MKIQVIKRFVTTKKNIEVRTKVENLLMICGKTVFRSEEDIEKFFNEEYEYTNPLCSEVVDKFTVRGEMNGNWETNIDVEIIAFYHDPGSDDYAYMVRVEEN